MHSTRFTLVAAAYLLSGTALAANPAVTFSQSAPVVQAYDFVEVAANIDHPALANCFTDVAVSGSFTKAGAPPVQVDGFCDSADGSVYRIRFMPGSPGEYTYKVAFRQGGLQKDFAGSFQATDGHRRGPIRVDSANPWHFIWEGTGEHYFFNGTTAFWLMGWKDERIIDYSIARLARLKVNRIRACIAGRTSVFYGEPAMNGEAWNVWLTPFPSKDPQDFSHPGFDWTRFNVSYWQKFDRMLRFARDRDVIMSLIFDMNDNHSHPAAGSEDEHRYFRYAAARFGAFSNVTWDLGDDLDRYRDEKWSRATGTLLEQWDPYKHLATTHPTQNEHQDRTSNWFGFTSFQEWSRDQHRFMLAQRKQQEATGRIIPQTNEEYGYEDHYPGWAIPLSDSADVLRRTAWDIYMAGGYQTAGETVRRGTNIWPDSGGGWMNGRGDDTMTMFFGFGHIMEFFTSFDWWQTEPHDELVGQNNYCVAKLGSTYAIYLPKSGKATVQLAPGTYSVKWFNPQTGEWIPIQDSVNGGTWTSPQPPGRDDWALLLKRAGA